MEAFYQEEVRLTDMPYMRNDALLESLAKVGLWLESPHSTFGLMLSGNPGNGKTTVLKTMQRIISLSGQKDPVNQDYYGGRSDAYLKIIKAYNIAELAKEENSFRSIKKFGLLAIDDLGTEQLDIVSYGNVSSPIVDLLYERYDNRLFTIISTNLLNRSIRERYGERMADRFNEMMTCVTFPDISFRRYASKND